MNSAAVHVIDLTYPEQLRQKLGQFLLRPFSLEAAVLHESL